MCTALGGQRSGILVRHTQPSFEETVPHGDRHRNTIIIFQSTSLSMSPRVRVGGLSCRWVSLTVLVIDYMLDLQSDES